MEILEFKDLIKHIPYEFHSFEIVKSNWKNSSQEKLISRIFGNQDKISISRSEILLDEKSTENRILETLMWGYPTKGRGKNIDKILEKDSFRSLQAFLTSKVISGLSIEELKKQIIEIDGLGISTMTKLLYFFRIKLDQHYCLILDDQIIKLIRENKYEELSPLIRMNRYNAISYYPRYLKILNELSNRISCEPEQIELFLYQFGRNLSKSRYGRKG